MAKENEEKPKYDFTGVAEELKVPFGDLSRDSGFFYVGDNNKPEGFYSTEGVFYGNNGTFSEMDVLIDSIKRRNFVIAKTWGDLAFGLSNPRARNGVLESAVKNSVATTERLKRL